MMKGPEQSYNNIIVKPCLVGVCNNTLLKCYVGNKNLSQVPGATSKNTGAL